MKIRRKKSKEACQRRKFAESKGFREDCSGTVSERQRLHHPFLSALPSGTLTLDCCQDICLGLVLWAGELVMEWHTSLLGWNMIFSDGSEWGVLVSDHSVSCSSDERICQVVKAQIWELEDLATAPEAATAYLWFWKRQRMTDIRCSIFQWLNDLTLLSLDSVELSLLTLLGTLYFRLSIKHVCSSNHLVIKEMCVCCSAGNWCNFLAAV